MISGDSIQIIYSIFLVINAISLILLGIGYFMSRFKIVDLETWNSAMEIVEEYADARENNNCGGGVGFQIYDASDDEYEEEEKSNKSIKGYKQDAKKK